MGNELVTTIHRNSLKPLRNTVLFVSGFMYWKIFVGVWFLIEYGYFHTHTWMIGQLVAVVLGIASATAAMELLHRMREERVEKEITAAVGGPKYELAAAHTGGLLHVDVIERTRRESQHKQAVHIIESQETVQTFTGEDADEVISAATDHLQAYHNARMLADVLAEHHDGPGTPTD